MARSWRGPVYRDAGDPSDEFIVGRERLVSLEALIAIDTEATLGEFAEILEWNLDRPVLNETGIEGTFHIRVPEPVEGEAKSFNERLRERTGLVISPAERNVECLVVKARQDAGDQSA